MLALTLKWVERLFRKPHSNICILSSCCVCMSCLAKFFSHACSLFCNFFGCERMYGRMRKAFIKRFFTSRQRLGSIWTGLPVCLSLKNMKALRDYVSYFSGHSVWLKYFQISLDIVSGRDISRYLSGHRLWTTFWILNLGSWFMIINHDRLGGRVTSHGGFFWWPQ